MRSTNSMSAEVASLSSGVPVIGFNWLQAQVHSEKGHIINNLWTLLFGHYREISDLSLDVMTSLSLGQYIKGSVWAFSL